MDDDQVPVNDDCLNWSHVYNPSDMGKFESLIPVGAVENNYCRNPEGKEFSLFCYKMVNAKPEIT